MGFSKGIESKDAAPLKRYIGIAPVYVVAVNPTKAELEKIYDREITNDPTYLGKSNITVGGVEKEVASMRLDFIIKTDPNVNNGIEVIDKVTFFLNNENRFNSDATKVQVIDKYGRTAWATVEELETKSIPQYSNGPAALDEDFRAALIGEEALTSFIIDYLNLPNPQNYKNGKWVDKTPKEMEQCRARFGNLTNIFKGDISEVKDAIGLQPNNKIKVLFGVKTTDEGNMYQDIYNRKFMKSSSSYKNSLVKDVTNSQDNGAYPNTEFSFTPLREYSVEATDFSTEAPDPFDGVSGIAKSPFN